MRADLARASALEVTGAYAEGLAVTRKSLERAETIGWPPLTAAVRVRVGSLLEDTGAYPDEEAMHERAFFEAVNAGALEEAWSAAEGLAYLVGYRSARYADGERWSKHGGGRADDLGRAQTARVYHRRARELPACATRRGRFAAAK